MNISRDQTNELIKQAYEHAARKFFINKKAEAELFSKLNLIAEPNAIPLLLPLVFSHNKRLAETVASTLHKIVVKIPVDTLESLDEMIRRVADYDNQSWDQITVNQVKGLNFEKPVCNTIYVLLCSHHNGYIREQAIKGLLPEFSELNIPILLIRANDWVDKIKLLVSEKLIEIINNNKISNFIPSLNLIAQLYQKGRYDHSNLISTIEGHLIEKCYDKLLLAITSFPNRKISRVAFRIAAKNTAKILQLVQISSQSSDIIIKLEILNVASCHLSGDMLFEFLNQCLIDKSPIIRRKCIHICLEELPQRINHILINTLFDKSVSLRELARFYLKDNDTNIAEIYQETLINKNKPLNIAIMGLAEVGNQDDFKLIEPHIRDASLNVRAACIYAIFKLNPDNKQELILEQLLSHEPKIIKTIYAGLIKNSDGFDIDMIEKVFCQEGDFYSNMLFIKMKIATTKDRWGSIEYLLDQIQKVENDKIKLFLEHKVSLWIITNSPNKIFTRKNKDFLLSLMTKINQLILQGNNVDLYISLKKNIECFIE